MCLCVCVPKYFVRIHPPLPLVYPWYTLGTMCPHFPLNVLSVDKSLRTQLKNAPHDTHTCNHITQPHFQHKRHSSHVVPALFSCTVTGLQHAAMLWLRTVGPDDAAIEQMLVKYAFPLSMVLQPLSNHTQSFMVLVNPFPP